MVHYSIEPRTRKCVKGYGFLSFARILDTGLDALKTASKIVVHKAAEATGEFKGNKVTDKIVKQKPVIDENSRDAEKVIIPPEKREEISKELRQVS